MNNQERFFQALAEVLKVDVASLNDSSSPDTVPGWDSHAVIDLVAELEATFQVEFDVLEIADFHNVSIIKSVLMEKGITF